MSKSTVSIRLFSSGEMCSFATQNMVKLKCWGSYFEIVTNNNQATEKSS